MSIPKYAFTVEVTYAVGDQRNRIVKNYETLIAAMSYSSIAIRKSNTCRVRVLMVIDDIEVHHVK